MGGVGEGGGVDGWRREGWKDSCYLVYGCDQAPNVSSSGEATACGLACRGGDERQRCKCPTVQDFRQFREEWYDMGIIDVCACVHTHKECICVRPIFITPVVVSLPSCNAPPPVPD